MSTVLLDLANVAVLVWLWFVARCGWRNGKALLRRLVPGGRHARRSDQAPPRGLYLETHDDEDGPRLAFDGETVRRAFGDDEPGERITPTDVYGTRSEPTWPAGVEMPADHRADDGIRVLS